MNTPKDLPKRTAISIEDILYKNGEYEDTVQRQKNYKRIISKEATIYKAQFLAVEDNLVKSFQFVAPHPQNIKTFSINFASIIKEAANLYELICRHLCQQIFEIDINPKTSEPNINIYHYLSLDKYLDLSNIEITSYCYYDKFDSNSEIYTPFKLVKQWFNKKKFPGHECKPEWWKAYNELKHSNDGLKEYATLENAIAAVSAIFIVLHKIYGPGFVYGVLLTPENTVPDVPTSKIFMIEDKA